MCLDWAAIDTVILDMDGTVLDLYFDQEVWNRLLPERLATRHNCSVAEAERVLHQRLDSARGSLAWYCLDHWRSQLGIDIGGLECELSHLVRLRPQVETFLQFMQADSRCLILATNAHPQSMQRKFQLTGIASYFDHVVSAHSYGYCKEELGFWQKLDQEFKLPRSRTLFIDDNHAVLSTARRFGIGYLFAVRYPSSRGDAVDSTEFPVIDDFSSLLPGPDGASSARQQEFEYR